MARPFSEGFLRELNSVTEHTIGTELAKLCVTANIPATHVAMALGTTRLTVYGWFRGKDIRKANRKNIEAFIKLLEEDFSLGVLPAKSIAASKAYISGLIGAPV
jgi:hypothetical protein